MKTIDGRKYIEANVVMLATDKSKIYIDEGKLYYKPTSMHISVNPKPYHLYITTDEEIKEGDWIIDGENKLHQIQTSEPHVLAKARGERKIIATTNPKLTQCSAIKREGESCPKNNNCRYPSCTVAQIPQSFIKEYCKAGGIDIIFVELEEY